MERAAIPGRLRWRLADVLGLRVETPRVTTIALSVPGWPGHLPGQHVDVRLTAEDGYEAQRSYSIATAPSGERMELTVERLDDGEVSSYLTEVLRPGDGIEVRGPIGGHFVWDVDDGGPLQLIAGGSGVVPLMAMLRHRVATGSHVPARLLSSSRSFGEIIYRDELARLGDDPAVEVTHTLTRIRPPGWDGYGRRIDAAMLAEVAWPASTDPRTYVCGPSGLVEAVASGLVDLGHDPARIRTERFGPT